MLWQVLENSKLSGKKLQIKLLGDSITHGVGGTGFNQDGEHIIGEFYRNPNGYCWAKLFKEYMEQNYNCNVINNACTGTNIEFIIEYFDVLIDATDDLVVCMIGTNNTLQEKGAGEKKDCEKFSKEFYDNVLKLNELFRIRNKFVIFMASIPMAAKNEDDGDWYWRILHMDDINAIYKKARETVKFSFISMYDLFSAYIRENDESLNTLLCDGIHPNDKGYEIMFRLLKEELNI